MTPRLILQLVLIALVSFLFTACSRDDPLELPKSVAQSTEVECDAPEAESVQLLSGFSLPNVALTPFFSESIFSYDASVGYLVESIVVRPMQIMADGSSLVNLEVKVNGETVPFGESSSPILLDFGINEINVTLKAKVRAMPTDCEEFADVTRVDVNKTYVITLRRASFDDLETQDLAPNLLSISSGDEFGKALSISGDVLAVGVPSEDGDQRGVFNAPTLASENDNSVNSGAVYLFERSSTGEWGYSYYIKSSNSEAGDRFGHSVSLNGDLLAVSALGEDSKASGINGRQDDNIAADSGAVYLFEMRLGQWSQIAYIKPPQNVPGDNDYRDSFGHKVLLRGNVLLVSAPAEDSVNGEAVDSTEPNSGAVYVYERNSQSGVWAYKQTLKADIARTNDKFGMALAMSGDTIAVGAPFENTNSTNIVMGANKLDDLLKEKPPNSPRLDTSAIDSGAVYLFTKTSGSWTQSAYIKASNMDPGDAFGSALAIKSGLLIVGAPQEDSNGIGLDRNKANNASENAGAVYVYRRLNQRWVETRYIKGQYTQAGARFGAALALDGNDLLVGAPLYDDMSNSFVDSGVGQHFVETPAGSWSNITRFHGAAPLEKASQSLAVNQNAMVFGVPGFNNLETGVTISKAGLVIAVQ